MTASLLGLLAVSVSAEDQTVYDVNGGWTVKASGTDMLLSDPYQPGFLWDNYTEVMLLNDSYVLPGGHASVYGRFQFDVDASSVSLILVNGINYDITVNDGYVYFSAAGEFDALGVDGVYGLDISIVTASGLSTYFALDYVKVKKSSWTDLPFYYITGGAGSWTSGTAPIDLTLTGPWTMNNYLVPEGIAYSMPHWENVSQSNLYYCFLSVPMSGNITDDSVLQFQAVIKNGTFVGSHVSYGSGIGLIPMVQVSSNYLGSQTHVFLEGHVAEFDMTSSEDNTYYERFDYSDYEERLFTYDTDVSLSSNSSILFSLDLSSVEPSESLYIILCFVGPPEGSSAYGSVGFDIDTFGMYLDSSDADLGEYQTLWDKFTGYFDDLTGDFFSFFGKLFGAGNEESAAIKEELGSASVDIEKMEQDHQQVMLDNLDDMSTTMNISGFAPALAFVSHYVGLTFTALGDYWVVVLFPIQLGLFMYVCSRARGGDKPQKSNFDARAASSEMKDHIESERLRIESGRSID